MRTAVWLLGLCGLCGLCAAICRADAIPQRQAVTVVVFGDSLALGAGPPVERADVWVRRVERASSGRLRMINESRAGRPTGAPGEFREMLGRRPQIDLLVLALGTNDSGDASAEAVPRAVANLRQLVLLARAAHGADLPVLIVGPPNMNPDALRGSQSNATQRVVKLEELNRAFGRLAGELGCRFVSLYRVLTARTLESDGMHPDAAGHKAIAQRLLPELLRTKPR